MEIERIAKIVLMELSVDLLKLEEELEKTINSDLEISIKTLTIKSLLSKIVISEDSVKKFTNMLNNNDKK